MTSELVWLGLGLAALTWELIGVFTEKRSGVEPLTRIVRDRLMKRSWVIRIVVILFLCWLLLHFLGLL